MIRRLATLLLATRRLATLHRATMNRVYWLTQTRLNLYPKLLLSCIQYSEIVYWFGILASTFIQYCNIILIPSLFDCTIYSIVSNNMRGNVFGPHNIISRYCRLLYCDLVSLEKPWTVSSYPVYCRQYFFFAQSASASDWLRTLSNRLGCKVWGVTWNLLTV